MSLPADQTFSSLSEAREAAKGCTRCPLYRRATQTVFGEGHVAARVMLVGEQPGDQEDVQGHPFVGPAGKVLDAALAKAGILRRETYVTNAVKHFKFEEQLQTRGKRRLHKRPTTSDIEVCKWWLAQEIGFVKPSLIVALGATAVYALTGNGKDITKRRGTIEKGDDGIDVFVTWHPSALLRAYTPEAGERMRREFDDDMQSVKRRLDGLR